MKSDERVEDKTKMEKNSEEVVLKIGGRIRGGTVTVSRAFFLSLLVLRVHPLERYRDGWGGSVVEIIKLLLQREKSCQQQQEVR